jgi:hypothetical protein
MENILIEKAENGFIVHENYERFNSSVVPTIGKTLVFFYKKSIKQLY